MAHKKAGGSSRNGRDSAGRRLGVNSTEIVALWHEEQRDAVRNDGRRGGSL